MKNNKVTGMVQVLNAAEIVSNQLKLDRNTFVKAVELYNSLTQFSQTEVDAPSENADEKTGKPGRGRPKGSKNKKRSPGRPKAKAAKEAVRSAGKAPIETVLPLPANATIAEKQDIANSNFLKQPWSQAEERQWSFAS